MRLSSSLALLVTSIGVALASPAMAANVTGAFNATSSVIAACNITTNAGINFGNYDSVTNKAQPLNATSTVGVLCTKGAAVSVGLDQGKNPKAGSTCVTPQRQLKSAAGDVLAYGVFYYGNPDDPDEASAWGCDASNAATFTSATGMTEQVLRTGDNIRSGQDVPAGAYSDQVVVTVTF